jgi:hypothetical protein
MTILALGSRVVLKVKDNSCKRQALHLVICQAKCGARWNLPPPYRVSFDSD